MCYEHFLMTRFSRILKSFMWHADVQQRNAYLMRETDMQCYIQALPFAQVITLHTRVDNSYCNLLHVPCLEISIGREYTKAHLRTCVLYQMCMSKSSFFSENWMALSYNRKFLLMCFDRDIIVVFLVITHETLPQQQLRRFSHEGRKHIILLSEVSNIWRDDSGELSGQSR